MTENRGWSKLWAILIDGVLGVVVVFLGIIILAATTDVLPKVTPQINWSGVTVQQWVLIGVLLLAGGIIGVCIHYVTISRTVTGRHKEFCESFDRWRTAATSVLTFLEGEAVNRGALLMEPRQYAEFITNTNSERFVIKRRTHADCIRLCGSMVGFAFLLPSSLRQHACRAQTVFTKLQILGTDLKQLNGNDMFWFSVYLVAQTVQEMWNEQCCIKALVAGGHNIMIDIRYVPHDVLAAVINLPTESLAVLQALDPDSFNRILDGVGAVEWTKKQYQLGFKFNNEEGTSDEYWRYSRALDHIWWTYRNRSEVWLLHNSDDGPGLKVWNSRWWCTSKNDPRTLQPKTEDTFDEGCRSFGEQLKVTHAGERYPANLLQRQDLAEFGLTESGMSKGLKALVEVIPQRNSDIQNILKAFRAKEHLLGGIRNIPFA